MHQACISYKFYKIYKKKIDVKAVKIKYKMKEGVNQKNTERKKSNVTNMSCKSGCIFTGISML